MPRPARKTPGPLRRLLPCLLLGVLLPSCVKVPIDREVVAVHRYVIDPEASETRADTTLPILLLVDPFLGSAEQRGERMLYTDEENGMNYYYYNRWTAPPEKMVGDALVRDLTDWGLFGRGVYQGDAGIIPTHEIQGRLIKLYADNLKGQVSTVFEAGLTVLRIDPRTLEKEIIYQQSFPVVIERKDRKIDSHAAASNQAVRTWLDQVRSELDDLFRREMKTETARNAGVATSPPVAAPAAAPAPTSAAAPEPAPAAAPAPTSAAAPEPAPAAAPAPTSAAAPEPAPAAAPAPILPDSAKRWWQEFPDTATTRPAAPPDTSGKAIQR